MNKKLLVIPLLIVFISGCMQTGNLENITNTGECVSDSDCVAAGCSGEVCVHKNKAENVITTCVWKEEYKCLHLTKCGCVNGKCQFVENKAFKNCMESMK